MARKLKKGAKSQSIQFVVLDSTSTTGGRKTGLAYNTSSLTAYYTRNGGSPTAITLATLAAANSAWSSGGFKELDATNKPGWYRLDLPDAAVATGADSVGLCIRGATGMVQVDIEIQLEAIDAQDTVRAGLTALPNAAAEAAGGLYTRGSGAGQITQPSNGLISVNATQLAAQTITAAAGVTFPTSVASPTNITAGTITTVTNLTNAPTAGDFTATMKTSIGTAVAASAVASVTGAVGSVTGNVGGNVTGSVGSVASGGITAASIAASALNGKGDWNIGKTGYALSSAGVQAIWDALTSAMTTVGSLGKLVVDNLNATVSSRLASASYTAPLDASATATATQTGLTAQGYTSTRAGYLDTLNGLVSAIWSAVTRTLTAGTNIVLAKGTGVTGFTDLDAAGVRTAVGLASANLDTQLDALPTNAELATALGTADDAVLAAIAALNNLSSAGAQAAASAALTAYGAALQSTSTAIKAKTDNLTFTSGTFVDANIKAVNDVTLTGTGVETTDEWRPA